MSCGDKIKDQNLSSEEKKRMEMELCIGKCGDEMLKILPSFTQRMREWFSKGEYN
jgi:hypothetical protein